MKDIRYVSLSDLHLGAENSVLTRLTSVSNGALEWKADPNQGMRLVQNRVSLWYIQISGCVVPMGRSASFLVTVITLNPFTG
jgi:hypothetical protein